MANEVPRSVRPLCPLHHEAMVLLAEEGRQLANTPETIEMHGCCCPVHGCPHNYSLSFGYFTIGRNNDYWSVTGSSSLRVTRNGTQAICGHHKIAMFIESFNPDSMTDCFRCPEADCDQWVEVSNGGPSAYWLGSGYFGTQ